RNREEKSLTKNDIYSKDSLIWGDMGADCRIPELPPGLVRPSDQAIAELYGELRRIAAAYLREERSDHTLQPTALVHEAYLRLSALNRIEWANRALVLGVAAGIMRRILVSHARRRNALKRVAPSLEVAVDSAAGSESQTCDALALNAALQRMERSYSD